MRAVEFVKLDEAGVVNSIANAAKWAYGKYNRSLNTFSEFSGKLQMNTYVSKHIQAFINFMGRYRIDWSTISMYVVYRYLQLGMHLSNDDIVSVVNEVLSDSTSGANQQNLSLQQIQDTKKQLRLSRLVKVGRSSAQNLVEMIIAAAAIRGLERQWEEDNNVHPMNFNHDHNSAPTTAQFTGSELDISKDDITRIISILKSPNGGKNTAIKMLRQLLGDSNSDDSHELETPSFKAGAIIPGTRVRGSDGNTYEFQRTPNAEGGFPLWVIPGSNNSDPAEPLKTAPPGIRTELNKKYGVTPAIKEHLMLKLRKIIESASSGSTSSGSIASIANPIGSTISRTPNLFGYIPYESPKTKKRYKKTSESNKSHK